MFWRRVGALFIGGKHVHRSHGKWKQIFGQRLL